MDGKQLSTLIEKKCNKCFNTYPKTLDYFHSDGKKKLKATCKICVNNLNIIKREIHKKPKIHLLEYKTCKDCKSVFKNIEEFFPKYGFLNKNSTKHGLYSRCHKCYSEYATKQYEKLNIDKNRVCNTCKNEYPLTVNYYNKSSIGIYHYSCKECSAKRGRSSRLQTKNKKLSSIQKIGNLEILHILCEDIWFCKCFTCKTEYKIKTHRLTKTKEIFCGCLVKSDWKDIPSFVDYRDIAGTKWRSIIEGAKLRNIEFNIKIQDVWELFEKQNRQCYYSKLPISFLDKTASVDRKDNNKGYTIENISIVHKDINQMKMDFTEDYFIKLCACVLYTNKERDAAVKYYTDNGWKRVSK